MNRFYLHGFEDLRAEYLPKLEETKKSLGVINLVLMLDRKYKSLHNQSLFPDLVLQPQITIVPTPTWFDRMLYSVGFAGALEWLADIISSVDAEGSTRDKAAVSLLETKLRAKSYSLLLDKLKLC